MVGDSNHFLLGFGKFEVQIVWPRAHIRERRNFGKITNFSFFLGKSLYIFPY